MNRSLTVFILTYNRPEFLAQCLGSLCHQTFKDFRVVVLDNASAVDCGRICREFVELDLTYVRHENNIGSLANFHYAWSQDTDTPFFTIFHDDDLMHPTLLAQQIAILNADASLAWVGSGMKGFVGQEPTYEQISQETFVTYDSAGIAAAIMKGLVLSFSSVMYRSSIRKAVYLEKMFERYSIIFDRPLLFSLVEEGRCGFIGSPLVYYRQHADQESRIGPLRMSNLLALNAAFRRALSADWSPSNEALFYRWSTCGVIDAVRRFPADKRGTLKDVWAQVREDDLLRISDLAYYPVFLAKNQLRRIPRIPTKLARTWRRLSSKLGEARFAQK